MKLRMKSLFALGLWLILPLGMAGLGYWLYCVLPASPRWQLKCKHVHFDLLNQGQLVVKELRDGAELLTIRDLATGEVLSAPFSDLPAQENENQFETIYKVNQTLLARVDLDGNTIRSIKHGTNEK